MSLVRRTSARRALRQLSISKLNQSESQPSPSATMRENTKPHPQAQSKPTCNNTLRPMIALTMKLSALIKALLNDGQSEPGTVCAILGERLISFYFQAFRGG
ncbi:hypothetical protein F5Y19DRAFT_359317 [Xylariaceae sp. FL1651]|nr:hypothetical protein F5Y19DRAFT_359317 [Xylariaceae sp. FL1651]